MKCTEIRTHFSAYIDGEAGGDIQKSIEQHTAECRDCANELDELTHMVRLCNSLQTPALPKDFSQRLRDRLENEKALTPWYKSKKLYTGAAGLAACLLLVLGPIYGDYLRSGKNTEPVAPPAATESSGLMQNAPAEKIQPPQSTAQPTPAAQAAKENEQPPQSALDQENGQPPAREDEAGSLPPQGESAPPPQGEHAPPPAQDGQPQPPPLAGQPQQPEQNAPKAKIAATDSPAAQYDVPESNSTAPADDLHTPDTAPFAALAMPSPTAQTTPDVQATPEAKANLSIGSASESGGGSSASRSMMAFAQVLYVSPGKDAAGYASWISKNIPTAKAVKSGKYKIYALSGDEFDKASVAAEKYTMTYSLTNAQDEALSDISSELTGEYYIVFFES